MTVGFRERKREQRGREGDVCGLAISLCIVTVGSRKRKREQRAERETQEREREQNKSFLTNFYFTWAGLTPEVMLYSSNNAEAPFYNVREHYTHVVKIGTRLTSWRDIFVKSFRHRKKKQSILSVRYVHAPKSRVPNMSFIAFVFFGKRFTRLPCARRYSSEVLPQREEQVQVYENHQQWQVQESGANVSGQQVPSGLLVQVFLSHILCGQLLTHAKQEGLGSHVLWGLLNTDHP